MRKQIIITLILLIVVAYVTVAYFKNLNPPGTHTSKVLDAIPDNASLVFEFNNDAGFYDIFKDNQLFAALIGEQQLAELDTLRQQLLQNPLLSKYLSGQNVFISAHPSPTKNIVLLLTMTAAKGFGQAVNAIAKQPNSSQLVTPLRSGGKQGYIFFIGLLRKKFYLINNDDDIFSGSFSPDISAESAAYKNAKSKPSFVLLPEQQNVNSLANIYINYSRLDALFDALFKNKNTDIFKSFRLLPGLAALSLNYKTDALMFNGVTTIQPDKPASYLNLFTSQQPVVNHLKDIFPSTTAYATSFSVSDPLKFCKNLAQWYAKAGIKNEEDALFSKVQAETATQVQGRFNSLLGNEFAIVTTRYFEKLAIISVTDGSRMNLLLTGISKMTNENTGQLSYDKLPFFLLGDAFSVFRHPYFLIVDNYLVLANSSGELKSYYDSYINRKFLSKNDQYELFDNMLAAQSNIAFLLILKNAEPIFKRDMDADFYDAFETNDPGWKSFYGASLQFTAADKNFYTNFSLRLNIDSTSVKN